MKSSFFVGLNEKERKDAEEDFKASFRFRKRMIEILEKEIDSIVASMCNDESYMKDWSLLQAQKIAEIKSRKKFISFLE